MGNYYVIVTTYWHLLFDTAEGVNPISLGPCLIHSGKEYNSYYRLPESMFKANQNCQNILLFGTDAEENVYQVFRDILSNAYHLLCDIHMKKDIKKKLTKFGTGKGYKQEITKDIFGSTIGDSVVKGLVESNSHDEFENNAEELMQKWCALGNSEAQFSEYFRLHKLQHIRNCVTAELHAMVGLGFPPKPYTQNANECINSVVKRGKERRSLTLKSIV